MDELMSEGGGRDRDGKYSGKHGLDFPLVFEIEKITG